MAKRTKIRIIPLIILFVIVAFVVVTGIRMATLDTSLSITNAYEFPVLPELSDLSDANFGQQAVAIDGKIVYSKNNIGAPVMPIASTVKIILALSVMEKKPFNLGEKGEIIVISDENYTDYTKYVAINGSTTPVSIGEKYSEYDALALVLMASSNNMADTLASWAFGSIDSYHDFAMQMLESWGISDIHFGTDASGYDVATTGSAKSMAIIAERLMLQPVLVEIVGRIEYNVENVGIISNTNKLLGVDRISGVKTGFNGDSYSGYCLISSYLEPFTNMDNNVGADSIGANNHVVTIALLGAPTRTLSFADSQAIVETIQSAYIPIELTKTGVTVGTVDAWWVDKTDVIADGNVSLRGYKGQETSAKLQLNITDDNSAQTISGSIELQIDDEKQSTPVKTAKPIKTSPNLWERFLHVFGWSKN